MKKQIILFLLFVVQFSYAQNGSITLLNAKNKTFVYHPDKTLTIPQEAKVNVFFKGNMPISVPLNTENQNYIFSLQIPDSIQVALATISGRNGVVDNNQQKGYTLYFNNNNTDPNVELDRLQLSGFAKRFLDLKIPTPDIVNQYKTVFSNHPELKKKTEHYGNYLSLKYLLDKDKNQAEVAAYADLLASSNNENDVFQALNLYQMLGLEPKVETLINTFPTRFPKGKYAKRLYIGSLMNQNLSSEEEIMTRLQNYINEFGDDENTDFFYQKLLNLTMPKNDSTQLKKYESSVKNKLSIASLYNQKAWELSGEDLTTPATNLPFALYLSKSSLEFVKSAQNNQNKDILQGNYNAFADTYALLLYKANRYSEAFEYQESINKLGGLDNGGKNRYAVFAEKAKGAEFAKNYIEKELADGGNSKTLLVQLKVLYQQLSLPAERYEAIKQQTLQRITQVYDAQIQQKFRTTQAPDFSLINRKGKAIKLSSLKGKTAVLDFWATWCGPCKASFPSMQQLVTKHSNTVEFLFIDTMERTNLKATQTKVEELMTASNYTFNVLFDSQSSVAGNYQVEHVPTRVVIDKTGKIIAYDIQEDELETLLSLEE